MCTAATYKTKDFYFGRTLDYEISYGDQVVITPRNYVFDLREGGQLKNHYAMIGMEMCIRDRYKTLEPLEAIDILIAPENIRENLKSENDIYKFEYCSLDEKTYKIASYIPLEWKNGKLEKVLLASMDVTQEKKAEI